MIAGMARGGHVYVWISSQMTVALDSFEVRDIIDQLATMPRYTSLDGGEVDPKEVLATHYCRTTDMDLPNFTIARGDIAHSRTLNATQQNVSCAALEIFEKYPQDFSTISLAGILFEWQGKPLVFLENTSVAGDEQSRVTVVDLYKANELLQKRAKIIHAQRQHSRFVGMVFTGTVIVSAL